MRKDLLNIKMDDLVSSHAIENMYVFLAALFLISFALIPFLGYADLIDHVIAAVAIFVAIASFLHTYQLYGLKSKEGWAWLLLSVSVILILLASLLDAFDYGFLYFIFRFVSIPIMTAGLGVKLWFTGMDLTLSQKTVSAITFVGWILLIFVSSVLPVLDGEFDYVTDAYAFYALAEIIALMVSIFIIQTIRAKGWYFISIGLILISMGDIFHPLAENFGLIYPGSPIRLFWYLGLLVAAFGAFYQRKEHLKYIAI